MECALAWTVPRRRTSHVSLRWFALEACCGWLLALSASLPTHALAFSSPETYDLPTLEAGGGGRFFTGTPADGFGCDVCHEGGPPVELQIAGLPVDGYEPGASYEITITWPLSAEHIALLAEITDESRQKAGTLTLPRFESMTSA